MKKFLYFSVALLTTLSLGACGDDEPDSGSDINVQFSTSSYTLDDEPIEIKVRPRMPIMNFRPGISCLQPARARRPLP